MMFKGTPRRSAEEVNLDFDRIGASYNAYTSEENTVYYAAVLPEYLPQGSGHSRRHSPAESSPG